MMLLQQSVTNLDYSHGYFVGLFFSLGKYLMFYIICTIKINQCGVIYLMTWRQLHLAVLHFAFSGAGVVAVLYHSL